MHMPIERAVRVAGMASKVQCGEARQRLQIVISQIHTALAEANGGNGSQQHVEKVELLVERAEAILRERGMSCTRDVV